jgi:CDP-diacylglycerol---serine O-phosphatidyltransferase
VPRALWRMRRAPDTPRPAGRRWTGGLRRGGVLARRVLRVRRRRRDGPLAIDAFQPHPPYPAITRPVIANAGLDTVPAPSQLRPSDPTIEASLLPGDRTMGRQLRFALVNLCTLGSLALGLLAILLAMRGDVQLAAVCLIACVACDGVDGMLARRLGVSSPFGAQMDSLADMCAFGVAAPVVLYASLVGSVPTAAVAVACALVAGCAAIRLARFNVSGKDGKFFTGVPTTAVAAVLAVAVLIEMPLSPAGQLVGLSLLAFAMVSSFPYATLARLVRLPAWLWLVPLAGAMVNAQLTFVLLVAAYLLSGPAVWMHHRRAA